MTELTDFENLFQFVDDRAASRLDEWRRWRRLIHEHPERSWQETRTTAFLRERLREMGLEMQDGPRRLGGYVDFNAPLDSRSGRHGDRVAVRGDIDAIPVHEANEVAYRSRCAGVMHACGHDAHATAMLGVAETLAGAEREGLLPAGFRSRVIFQPAEETGEGAAESIQAGVLSGVAAIFGLHVDPSRQVGEIGLRDGAQTAACDELKFEIEGSGGHGARPHETADTILAATYLVQTAHALIPRIKDAQRASVLSFCRIQGGESFNVIPTRVELLGTLRTFDAGVRRQILDRVAGVVNSLESLFNARCTMSVGTSIPPTDNCPRLNALVRSVGISLLGEAAVTTAEPSMGGEDFAFYQKDVPGALIRVGSADGERCRSWLHSPHFDVDERVVAVAVRLLIRCLVARSVG